MKLTKTLLFILGGLLFAGMVYGTSQTIPTTWVANLEILKGLATTTNAIIIGSNASGWTSVTATGTQATALNLGSNAYNSTAFLSALASSTAPNFTVSGNTIYFPTNLTTINSLATTTYNIIYGSNASGWLATNSTSTEATVLGLGSNAYNSTAFLSSATATSSKAITVETPTASDNITIFTTHYPITINRVGCINNPVSGNSTTFNLMHHTARATTATTTAVFASNKVCTATSTPTYWVAADFQDATMAINEMLWLTTSAASSTGISITIDYLYD